MRSNIFLRRAITSKFVNATAKLSYISNSYQLQPAKLLQRINPSPSSSYKYDMMVAKRFLSMPAHKVVPMPSLSPTMEIGSIAKWNMKEGDKFEAGQAICEVETDKATVTYDATDDGYIAKILVGTGEVKVGQPLMVIVEELEDVAAFKDYNPDSSSSSQTSSKPSSSSQSSSQSSSSPSSSQPSSSSSSSSDKHDTSRVFASPLARKLARDDHININDVVGSGPRGRIIAADVMNRNLKSSSSSSVSSPASSSPVSSPASSSPVSSKPSSSKPSSGVDMMHHDDIINDAHHILSNKLLHSKQSIPHYYLSTEVNLSKLLQMRDHFNRKSSDSNTIGVLDVLIKVAAMAMKQVPDVNASWHDTFVRRYDQVDINIITNVAGALVSPVVRDVNGKGLAAISNEIAMIEAKLASSDVSGIINAAGTFSIHNLGTYGIKSASPIILPPQSCSLAIGSIVDTVVPNTTAKDNEDSWIVAPMLTVTMSCDHRVVDGAVSAQYLQAFKNIAEDPMTLLL